LGDRDSFKFDPNAGDRSRSGSVTEVISASLIVLKLRVTDIAEHKQTQDDQRKMPHRFILPTLLSAQAGVDRTNGKHPSCG
jgi:hypothetical protein